MYSGFVEHTKVPIILRGRLVPALLVVIMVMAFHLWMKADAAAEIEPHTSAPKSYEIIFQGNTAISEDALRRDAAAELKSYETEGHRPADIDDAAFQMELAYRKAGYAFAAVNYQIEKKKTVPKITFLISEGPRVNVRDIIAIGNQALNEEDIKGYFQKGRSILFGKDRLVFDRSKIEAAVDEIRRYYTTHGYLDAVVDAPEFNFTEDRSQVTITLRIQEGIPYTVHRIEISGDGIQGAQDDFDKIRRELINQPYFKRQRLLLQTRLLEVCGNFGYPDAMVEIDRREGGEPDQVVLDAKITSGPRVTIAAIEVRGNERTRPDFIRNRMRLKPGDRYNLALQKESFRDFYRTGIFSKVDFELETTGDPAKRLLVVVVAETRAKELFFEPGWGSYEKLRLRGGGRQFFSLARYTVLGVRYTTGLILPGQGEVTLPLSERFFNGGENTVRSFKESELGPKDPSGNPVGGYGFNVFNLELRQRLIGNLIGTVFVDYGNVAPNRSRTQRGLQPYDSRSDIISDTFDDFFKDFRPGVGFGLQYLLPVGPARVDFAFNPDRRSQDDEDFFVMHFSIGTAF